MWKTLMRKACDERSKEDLSYEVRGTGYIEYINNAQYQVFQTFLFVDRSCLGEMTMDPSIFTHVNIECPDYMYPKLKFICQI